GSASDYLTLALQEGITCTNEVRGTGLSIVETLVHNGEGILVIRSQTARIEIAQGGQVRRRDNLAYFPGTQVFINLWGRPEKWIWESLLPAS
ncbi:MAG TPA: hypothetical protein VKQ72_07765, partial [Aggregatilineales bacterium]|nr:hypothetical protein [Aggregatilineales bacterium]